MIAAPRLAGAPLALIALGALAGPAGAGGQYVGDNGSQGMHRAGAFAAKADDPTAIQHNPAGLALVGRPMLFVGANVISMSQAFERDGVYAEQDGGAQPAYVGDEYPRVEHAGRPQPVPFAGVVIPAGRYALGLGVFAPHGYASREYPETVATASGAVAPAPQRYDALYQSGTLVLPSAAGAWRVTDRFRVGARVSYGFAHLRSAKRVQGLPNDGEAPGRDSLVLVDVRDGSLLTFGAGFHLRASPALEIGGSYAAPIRIDARGTSDTRLGDELRELVPGQTVEIIPVPDAMARCEPGGAPGAIKTCLDMALPQMATLGARWIARDAAGEEVGDLEVDVRWEDWSSAADYRVVTDGMNSALGTPIEDTVIRHGFRDTISVRLGGSGRLRRGARSYLLRGGVAYDTAAAPRSWTRLDVDGNQRVTFAGGVGVELSSVRIDVGGAFVDSPRRYVPDQPIADPSDPGARVQPDVPVPLNAPDQQPYHPFNAGQYWSRYLIGSVGLTAWW